MNLLDENILADQRRQLRGWRISIRHIGFDIGRKGMTDDEIIPFLRRLSRPTFFTRDRDFYKRHLCHARYCLVSLAVDKRVAAVFVRPSCATQNSIPVPNDWARSFVSRRLAFRFGVFMRRKRRISTGRPMISAHKLGLVP